MKRNVDGAGENTKATEYWMTEDYFAPNRVYIEIQSE